jgi:tellurite resistance protein
MTDEVTTSTPDELQAAEDAQHLNELDALTCVVRNELLFKKKLGVGEGAFTTVMIARTAQELAGAATAASAAAGVASSATVAGTFFASGWMSALGLGAFAVTPIGWVVGAAVVTGSAYYGVTRLLDRYCSSRVDKIPHFLNSNIDVLGMTILDALGAVALRVAAADGAVTGHERDALHDYFVDGWGFDPAYARVALSTLEDGMADVDLERCVRNLTEAAIKHPDCTASMLKEKLHELMEEVAGADGRMCPDERKVMNKIKRLIEGTAAQDPAQTANWLGRFDWSRWKTA